MKLRYALLYLSFFALNITFSQTQKNIFFKDKVLIHSFHTIDQLENLKKGELITLYTERIKEIVTVMPYLALTHETDVSLSDVGIKESSGNLKILGKQHDANTDAFKSTSNMISEFVPYADTEKIISSILYFEEIIKKIRIGVHNNF